MHQWIDLIEMRLATALERKLLEAEKPALPGVRPSSEFRVSLFFPLLLYFCSTVPLFWAKVEGEILRSLIIGPHTHYNHYNHWYFLVLFGALL